MGEKEQKTVLISAGGTGGHMFAADALARDLLSRGYKVVLATDARGQKYEPFAGGVPTHVIKCGGQTGSLFGKLKTILALGAGYLQSRALIRKIAPVVVVGFGGYPSFPPVYAGQHKKIPTIIHEQNAVLGKANEMLAPKADRIALGIAGTKGLEDSDVVRAVITGNPVRPEIAALYNQPYPAIEQNGELRIFVTGGSQGASVFSQILPEAFAALEESDRARLNIVQQCRAEEIESVREIYRQAGIKARLEIFFKDMEAQFAWSHLVISRSGAGTVAEVTTAGRPAIFVPYPHHADQQQKKNADAVAASGGAWVMTEDLFTPATLKTKIQEFLAQPETLFQAAEKARSCGKPDAARKLGNLVTALASGWDKDAAKPFDLTQGRLPE